MDYHIQPISYIHGVLTVPGDKSISHRSIICGAIATGETHVKGFLEGEDCLATIQALKACGVSILGPEKGEVLIHGVGLKGLHGPNKIIDLGNSGTSIRLLTGLFSAQPFEVTLSGDDSLLKRPMARIVEPLKKMGAQIETTETGTPPLVIQGNPHLRGISYELPIASAQVKSALLLAGLFAEGTTTIIEPIPTRDHTERMLEGFGVALQRQRGWVSIQGQQTLTGIDLEIPGDISSAAFFIVAALIIPNSHLKIQNVGLNSTRIGCLEILKRMGATINIRQERTICGEPVADLDIQSSHLRGIEIPQEFIAGAIDEFPILFIAAALAEGKTILRGAHELRVKESDRISGMAEGLKQLGVHCVEYPDGIEIEGGQLQGGTVNSFGDHRVAMSFCIAGLAAKGTVHVENCTNIKTSFPNFMDLLSSLTAIE